MFQDPFLQPSGNLSFKDAMDRGYTHFLTASMTFGEITDADGNPVVYDFAECFKEMDEDTLRDFYKRVADDACELIEED